MLFDYILVVACVLGAVLGVGMRTQQIKVAKTTPCPNCKSVGFTNPATRRTLPLVGGINKTMHCTRCGYRW